MQDLSVVSADRLLRLPDVEAITGLRKSAIYQAMKEGRFPPNLKLSTRCAAWSESEIQAWIAAKIRAPRRGAK